MFVKIDGEGHYLWRAVGHEGEVMAGFVTMKRDKKGCVETSKKAVRKHGNPEVIVAEGLAS